MSQHVEETVVFPKGADIKHHQTPPLWYTTMALGSVAYTFLVKRNILSMNRGVSLPASTTRFFLESKRPSPSNERNRWCTSKSSKNISHGSCRSPSNNNLADKQSRQGSQKQTVPDIPRFTCRFEGTSQYFHSIICSENQRNNINFVNVICDIPPSHPRYCMLFCNRQSRHQHKCAWILQISGCFKVSEPPLQVVNGQQFQSVYFFHRVLLTLRCRIFCLSQPAPKLWGKVFILKFRWDPVNERP